MFNRRGFFKTLAAAALGAAASHYVPSARVAPVPVPVPVVWSAEALFAQMNRETAESMFYGSPVAAADFTGLAPRYTDGG